MKSFALFVGLLLMASFVVSGCTNPEPEIDPNVPMGKDTDKFKPMQLQAAGGSPKKEAPKADDKKSADEKPADGKDAGTQPTDGKDAGTNNAPADSKGK